VSLDWFNLFQTAMARRIANEPRLNDPLQVGRFFAGTPDGIDGVIVDGFGPLVVLTVYNPNHVVHASQMLTSLAKLWVTIVLCWAKYVDLREGFHMKIPPGFSEKVGRLGKTIAVLRYGRTTKMILVFFQMRAQHDWLCALSSSRNLKS